MEYVEYYFTEQFFSWLILQVFGTVGYNSNKLCLFCSVKSSVFVILSLVFQCHPPCILRWCSSPAQLSSRRFVWFFFFLVFFPNFLLTIKQNYKKKINVLGHLFHSLYLTVFSFPYCFSRMSLMGRCYTSMMMGRQLKILSPCISQMEILVIQKLSVW